MAEIQTFTQRAYRQFGGARLSVPMVIEIPVQRQRNARDFARTLERRVAACVPARIEIGKTVQRLGIIRRIPQQMFHAKYAFRTAAKRTSLRIEPSTGYG